MHTQINLGDVLTFYKHHTNLQILMKYIRNGNLLQGAELQSEMNRRSGWDEMVEVPLVKGGFRGIINVSPKYASWY
jgi:hypothetical protein